MTIDRAYACWPHRLLRVGATLAALGSLSAQSFHSTAWADASTFHTTEVWVANNVELGALTGATRARREGFFHPGDGGAAEYRLAPDACTLNKGLGDDGAQVPAAEGGCWLIDLASIPADPRQWGAVCDGATNNRRAFQDAVNAIEATDGVLTIPPMVCGVYGTISITASMTIQGRPGPFSLANGLRSIIRQESTSGDTFAVQTRSAVVFRDLEIDAAEYQTSGAAISLTGENGGGKNNYNSGSLLSDVLIRNAYDGLRIDEAAFLVVENSTFLNFGDDGIKKINKFNPDGGDDRYTNNTYWDFNRGTSNACFEYDAGGDVALATSKFLGSNYGFLVNATYGPTGTARITGNSFEEQKVARIGVLQAVPKTEFGNLVITGNQFSSLAQQPSHGLLYVGPGQPNGAARWVRNVVFSGNLSNDAVRLKQASIDITDGDGIVISSNVLDNNNVPGPTPISVGSKALHVTVTGNQIIGYDHNN